MRQCDPFFQIGHQRGAVLVPQSQTILLRSAVDGAFDIEDRVDTADRLHCQRRDDGLFATLLELCGDIGQLEEVTARVALMQSLA